MQIQQADCLEILEPQSRFPGALSVLWPEDVCGNRVAAVARTAAGLRMPGVSLAVVDGGLVAAPVTGRALPILWMAETSWLPIIGRLKPRDLRKGRRLTRYAPPSLREEVTT